VETDMRHWTTSDTLLDGWGGPYLPLYLCRTNSTSAASIFGCLAVVVDGYKGLVFRLTGPPHERPNRYILLS
jgi:hypothetical protein